MLMGLFTSSRVSGAHTSSCMRLRLRRPPPSPPPRRPPSPPESDQDIGQDAAQVPPGPELTPVAHPPAPVVVPRWVQLVLLPLALLGLWALARAVGTVLLILIVAAVIALLLNTLVQFVERGRIPRGLAILIVYLGGVAAITGL